MRKLEVGSTPRQVSNCGFWCSSLTDCDPLVFGTLVLLKWRADDEPANALPPPLIQHSPPLPTPLHKLPYQDHALLNWMRCLMRAGAHSLDVLQVSQLAVQEASGVMVLSMLQKQGTMW